MKRWIVGLVVVVAMVVNVGQAEAAITFVSDAFSHTSTFGDGEWTIEQAPLGSGIPPSEPTNLTDGFTIGDVVFRYVAASGSESGAVGIALNAQRDFQAESGNFTNTIQLGFTVELVDTQDSTVWVQWEATTVHRLAAPNGQALVDGGDWLSPSDPLSVLVEDSASFFNPLNSGMDELHGGIGLYLHPTHAGQEFLIHFSPDVGVNATTIAGPNPNVVPEPTTLVIWSLLGTLAVMVGWWRRKAV